MSRTALCRERSWRQRAVSGVPDRGEAMVRSLGKNWWMFVVQGIIAILFGVSAIVWPGLTLITLVTLFGASAIVDGVAALFAMFQASTTGTPWWLFLIRGLIGLVAGITVFAWPGLTAVLLVYVIGARFLLTGLTEIVAAIA